MIAGLPTLKFIGVIMRPDADYDAMMNAAQAALSCAMTADGLDTSRLLPMPTRMLPVMEDPAGKRYIVTDPANQTLTPFTDIYPEHKTLPAAEIIPIPSQPTPEPDAPPQPAQEAPESAQTEETRTTSLLAEIAPVIAQRGTSGDLAPALLAMAANQNATLAMLQTRQLIIEKMTGLQPSGSLYKRLATALDEISLAKART